MNASHKTIYIFVVFLSLSVSTCRARLEDSHANVSAEQNPIDSILDNELRKLALAELSTYTDDKIVNTWLASYDQGPGSDPSQFYLMDTTAYIKGCFQLYANDLVLNEYQTKLLNQKKSNIACAAYLPRALTEVLIGGDITPDYDNVKRFSDAAALATETLLIIDETKYHALLDNLLKNNEQTSIKDASILGVAIYATNYRYFKNHGKVKDFGSTSKKIIYMIHHSSGERSEVYGTFLQQIIDTLHYENLMSYNPGIIEALADLYQPIALGDGLVFEQQAVIMALFRALGSYSPYFVKSDRPSVLIFQTYHDFLQNYLKAISPSQENNVKTMSYIDPGTLDIVLNSLLHYYARKPQNKLKTSKLKDLLKNIEAKTTNQELSNKIRFVISNI